MRRIPIIPTVIVLLAVAVMVRLGFWQLDRLAQKEALLARYEAAAKNSDVLQYLGDTGDWWMNGKKYYYRRANFVCKRVVDRQAISGRNAEGGSGIAHIVKCVTFGMNNPNVIEPYVFVVIGWSKSPVGPDWKGGPVTGIVAPMGKDDFKLVADPPVAGLKANERPNPVNIPNNHLAYAVQWFLFALTALVIYSLALRKRLAAAAQRG